MKNYPTNITDNQWQFIKKTLNFNNRKRKYDLRTIWNAIMYLVKTGCQWRMLPNDFPKWELVYYYYSKWANAEDFDLLLSKLREKVRLKRNQNREPSLGIMDSQSVRWGNNRSLNGFYGNKKVKGIKRNVINKKFLFSEFPGEKFCPESLILRRFEEKHSILYTDNVLAFGDYLDGGLTKNYYNLMFNNPHGTLLNYKERISQSKTFKQKLFVAKNYYGIAWR